MKDLSRRPLALLPIVLAFAALLLGQLAGCGAGGNTLTLATYLPITGPDAPIGLAMQHAIDLAVARNANLGNGYTLTTLHFDTVSDAPASVAASLVGNSSVVGVIGPTDGAAAQAMLPKLSAHSLLAMSLGTMPGSLTVSHDAVAGARNAATHPVLLRLLPSDEATGVLAADVAIRAPSDHGLGAHSAFIVDDGSLSGHATAQAAASELRQRGGSLVGQGSLTPGNPTSAQSITSAIVDAYPDVVIYCGSAAGATAVRGTLSQSGAGSLPVLVVGPGADDPDWTTQIGNPLLAVNSTGLLPFPTLPSSARASSFAHAYAAAYPHDPLLPESALAYDAAMDQISAIKSLVAKGTAITRAAVLGAVASRSYAGITGTLAFDSAGALTKSSGWSLYTVDAKGAWQFVASLNG